jgi:Alginate export
VVVRRWATGGVFAVLALTGSAGRARAQVVPPAPERLAVGDWELAPVVELRARPEYRRDLDESSYGTLVERARLGLDAAEGALEARVVLQDARTLDLGALVGPLVGPGSVGVTGAFEAWVEAHTDSMRPSLVRAGRQPITWGEGRLLGEADWSPAGRSLDAVRGRLVAGDGSFELLAAALTDPQNGVALDAYGDLFGARAEWPFDPLFAIEAYGLARIAQDNPLVSLDRSVRGETYTGALRLHGDARAWTWGAEGAYQLGRADDLDARRAAWAAAGHVAFAPEGLLLHPSLQLGGDYASGDSGGATYRTFDPLLPDVHRWQGAMELFAWSNEAEASARVAVTPWTDGVAAIEYRYARLAQPGAAWRSAYLTTIGAAPGNSDSSLGQELDAMVRWSPWEPLALEAGYSIFFVGPGARAILLADGIGRVRSDGGLSTEAASQFAYLQATLRIH